MSALIKCYFDKACTDQLFKNDISYDMQLGPRTGLDGDTGEVYSKSIFLRNEGDCKAYNIRVKEVGDLNDFFYMSTSLGKNENVLIAVPDMEPGAVEELILTAVIPKGTKNTSDYLEYTIEYLTAPRPEVEQETTPFTAINPKLYYKSTNIPDKAPAGKPYGTGPYGIPLYGQEGLIHQSLTVNGDLPILGMAHTFINADVVIASRYTGEEATIEDIQSYYTSRYMMLGCFDGPALPMWTELSNEQNLI